MKLIDLREMPGANLSVPNGMDSVSRGLVELREDPHAVAISYGAEEYAVTHTSPHCVKHGAMNRMSHDGIYRCPTCHVGCYLVENNSE